VTTIIRYRTRGSAPARPAVPAHLYDVGQTVRLAGAFWMSVAETSGVYRITATLPPRGGSLQYRIRSDDEKHERVTTQDRLEAVAVSQSAGGSTLIERTFGTAERVTR
jgi:hypothetical protein